MQIKLRIGTLFSASTKKSQITPLIHMKGLLLLFTILFCSFCTVNANDPVVSSEQTSAHGPQNIRELITFDRLPELVKDAHFGNEKKMEGLAIVEIYVVSIEEATDMQEEESTYEIIAIDEQGMNVVFTYDAYGNLQDIESDRMS